MYELLAKANIVYGSKDVIVDTLEKVVSYVTTDGKYEGLASTRG